MITSNAPSCAEPGWPEAEVIARPAIHRARVRARTDESCLLDTFTSRNERRDSSPVDDDIMLVIPLQCRQFHVIFDRNSCSIARELCQSSYKGGYSRLTSTIGWQRC